VELPWTYRGATCQQDSWVQGKKDVKWSFVASIQRKECFWCITSSLQNKGFSGRFFLRSSFARRPYCVRPSFAHPSLDRLWHSFLPLVKEGLICFEVILLKPYSGFARLFENEAQK
jgi:hypothetical protein